MLFGASLRTWLAKVLASERQPAPQVPNAENKSNDLKENVSPREAGLRILGWV
jgi:hypothetical protein